MEKKPASPTPTTKLLTDAPPSDAPPIDPASMKPHPTYPPPNSPPSDKDQIKQILTEILQAISSQTTTRPLSQAAQTAITNYNAIAKDLATGLLKSTTTPPN